MESTIKHPFKATTLSLKELCDDFYQYSNSRNRHQIDKPKNNRSKNLKKVLITQQIQKKARMDKKGLALRVFENLLPISFSKFTFGVCNVFYNSLESIFVGQEAVILRFTISS